MFFAVKFIRHKKAPKYLYAIPGGLITLFGNLFSIFEIDHKVFNIAFEALQNFDVLFKFAVTLFKLNLKISVNYFKPLTLEFRFGKRRLEPCILFFNLFDVLVFR